MRFAKPLVAALILPAALLGPAERVTVFIAGDSTAAPKLEARRPETGWGERLAGHFDTSAVRIENRAVNGRSTRSFVAEGRWDQLVADLRPGDYVLVQFGHNDAAKDRVDRYTLPADYARNLARFVADVRARRATPVLLTPVMRRRFSAEGRFEDSHGEYPDLVRAVAAEHGVPLVDMHRRSEHALRAFGPEGSRSLFLQLDTAQHANYPTGVVDNTHFSPRGAELMAALVVAGLRDLERGHERDLVGGLTRHLAARGAAPRRGGP